MNLTAIAAQAVATAAAIPGAFPSTVTTEQVNPNPNSAASAPYVPVTGLANLAARIVPLQGAEREQVYDIYPGATHKCILPAAYAFKAGMQVSDGTVKYEVLDSQAPAGGAYTRLYLQQKP